MSGNAWSGASRRGKQASLIPCRGTTAIAALAFTLAGVALATKS
jgi:hypothetical protein